MRVRVKGAWVLLTAVVAAIAAGVLPGGGGGDPTPTPTPTATATGTPTVTPTPTPAVQANLWVAPSPGSGCARSSSPAAYDSDTDCTLAAAVTAALGGDVILFKTGSYGSWAGTSKAVTLQAEPGQTASMSVSLGNGDANFVIDGFAGMGGSVCSGSVCSAGDFTIRNSQFTTPLVIDAVEHSDITIGPGNTFNNQSRNASCTDMPARIHLAYTSATPSGVTVTGNTFDGGDRDGLQTGTALTIEDNVFRNIEEDGGSGDCQHTDPIQGVGATGLTVTGNLIHDSANGIVDFDDTAGHTITDNACYSIARGACITLYSDDASTIEHNTAGAGMDVLELDKKTAHGVGSGTIVRNNVGPLSTNGQGVATNTNNLFSGASSPNIAGTPTFVGGATPTTWAGFCLAPGSTGITGSTTGGPVGVRCS